MAVRIIKDLNVGNSLLPENNLNLPGIEFNSEHKINKKVLIFRSLLNSAGEYAAAISQCSWYIASELKKRKIPFVFSNAKLTTDGGDFIGKDELKGILLKELDIGFVVLPITEFYIGGIKKICSFIYFINLQKADNL